MTKVKKKFSDSRLLPDCVYCGQGIEDRDHIPPKVFLEKPYPPDMEMVNSCISCNGGFALDEQYVACLIEVARKGTFEETFLRAKIKETLRSQEPLKKMLQAQVVNNEKFEIKFDFDRMHRVILKLARGHAAYDLSEFTEYKNNNVHFFLLHHLTDEQFEQFDSSPEINFYPEVGSRSMQRMVMYDGVVWHEVQQDMYRYMTYVQPDLVTVRIVISEYLGAVVEFYEE